MDAEGFDHLAALVGRTYAQQAQQARNVREQKIRQLLQQRKWPETGWDDATIELLLAELALMDSNNFLGNVGVGEREARVVCSLVARRHYRLGHGVGRSGDIAEIQPKAAGSSALARIARSMVLDLLHVCGITRLKSCLVLPVATGMSMVLTLLALRTRRPQARYVVWPRVDQKSCLKAIMTAGRSLLSFSRQGG